MGQKLLDYIITKNNISGSIPPAPMGLKQLKESIEGVPFNLLTKGMSGIFDKIGGQMQQLTQLMGGIQNMGGQAQQILSQVQNGTVSLDQATKAFGGVTAMTAGLSSFLPPEAAAAIKTLAPGSKTGG